MVAHRQMPTSNMGPGLIGFLTLEMKGPSDVEGHPDQSECEEPGVQRRLGRRAGGGSCFEPMAVYEQSGDDGRDEGGVEQSRDAANAFAFGLVEPIDALSPACWSPRFPTGPGRAMPPAAARWLAAGW